MVNICLAWVGQGARMAVLTPASKVQNDREAGLKTHVLWSFEAFDGSNNVIFSGMVPGCMLGG